jgi:tyrosyl-tRNA synthetase
LHVGTSDTVSTSELFDESVLIFQGISKTMYVNNMVKAGCTVKILIADWFAQMDNKIGSDLNKIRTIGYYNIEVWKAVGMDLDSVECVWLSDVMNCHAASIWPLVMDIGQKITLGGMKRYLLANNI